MSTTKPRRYIGLMSGTSIDSIDAAIVSFEDDRPTLLATLEYPITANLREQLIELCQPGDNEIERLGQADHLLGLAFADASQKILAKAGLTAKDITAIGSHGQTIRHRANSATPFTLQIGDPNIIAYKTGITTVSDFRRKDIASGGQGAPLAPAFHKAVFSSSTVNRAIINIGGIANITLLSANGECFGYDTGPGNGLMDAWIEKHLNKKYDENGEWGNSGNVIPELLSSLLEHDFLSLPHPKSTGREEFNLFWLESLTENKAFKAEDVQATLLNFTAHTITNEIKKLKEKPNEVYICGGGAYNKALMLQLEQLLHPTIIASTQQLGINPEWIEAAAFAWLAKQTLEKKPGNLSAVTGAREDVVLGAIYTN